MYTNELNYVRWYFSVPEQSFVLCMNHAQSPDACLLHIFFFVMGWNTIFVVRHDFGRRTTQYLMFRMYKQPVNLFQRNSSTTPTAVTTPTVLASRPSPTTSPSGSTRCWPPWRKTGTRRPRPARPSGRKCRKRSARPRSLRPPPRPPRCLGRALETKWKLGNFH
jgi:hypothetical protein